MAKIISVCAKNGGTGKTTTAIQLGAGLSIFNKKILLIDMSSQCNMTSALGAYNPDLVSIYDVISQKCGAEDAIQTVGRSLQIIQSELKVDNVNFEFTDSKNLLNLKNALAKVEAKYDFVIIDTPPAISKVTQTAMIASDEIILAVQPGQFSLDGLYQMDSVIKEIRNEYNPTLKIAGILVNRFVQRTTLRKEIRKEFEKIAENIGTKVYKTSIRENISIPESQVLKMSVFKYNKRSIGAADYFKFLIEFANDNGENKKLNHIPLNLHFDF